MKIVKPMTNGNEMNANEVHSILRKIHETHLALKDFIVEVTRTFEIVILTQLFYSVVFISISTYLFVTVPAAERTNDSLFFGAGTTAELAVFCFSGQFVTNKFEELYETLTQVCWYKFSKEEKLNYLIIMKNLQVPVVVRSNFNELSSQAFQSVS